MLITIDIEDHSGLDGEKRFARAIEPLLESLHSNQWTATFFVVGSLARIWQSELRNLPSSGHEIGLHGYSHRFLEELGPAGVREDLRRGREALEDITGTEISGYRAPYFGLTANTPWAPDLILDAGFTYSSSVLPAWNPQAGISSAPRRPFRWKNGLVEFPSPVFGIGPIAIPVLGGAYLRLLPGSLVKIAASRARNQIGSWTYAHPYDFDVNEPFRCYQGQTWLSSRLLFARRRHMLSRVLGVGTGSAPKLADLASDAEFVNGLESFDLRGARPVAGRRRL
jgi:polysaccharide deacetylase family protein (PEP-CTERM system associated)